MKQITIYTDGGSRGNPGLSALGVVISNQDKILAELSETLGITTNNVAEYTAVLRAHQWIAENIKNLTDLTISFYLDSLLVCSQLNGTYKIKQPSLVAIRQQIAKHEQQLKQSNATVTYQHIRRNFNKHADRLVNKALDQIAK